jgi:hypothetical protein
MTCHCVTRANKMLEERNTKINVAYVLVEGLPRIIIDTVPIDRRRKKINFVATFCPICGKRYSPTERRADNEVTLSKPVTEPHKPS